MEIIEELRKEKEDLENLNFVYKNLLNMEKFTTNYNTDNNINNNIKSQIRDYKGDIKEKKLKIEYLKNKLRDIKKLIS